MIDSGARRRSADPGCFSLLFVCTGNICRSPFAELLTRNLLIGRLGGRAAAGFVVASAGVHAVVDAPMHPDTRHELAPWRLDQERLAGRFRARQVRAEMVGGADLVLGLSPAHRAAVVELAPDALPSAFGLREFARLAASVEPCELPRAPVPRAHALVGLARRRRGMVPLDDPAADEVPDPMGGSAVDHHRAALLIEAAVRTIVDIVAAGV